MSKASDSTASKRSRRKTRLTVKISDTVARWVITFSGIATILAVLGVCLFLLWVVLPLFTPAKLIPRENFPLPASKPKHVVVDPAATMLGIFDQQWQLHVVALHNGQVVTHFSSGWKNPPLCAAFVAGGTNCVFGFEDGTVCLGSLTVKEEYLPQDSLPQELRSTHAVFPIVWDGGTLVLTPEKQYRKQSFQLQLQDPVKLASTPIVSVDISERPTGVGLVALSADGTLFVRSVRQRKNLLTGKITTVLTGGQIKLEDLPERTLPAWTLLSGLGDQVYLIWKSGILRRYNARDLNNIYLAETLRLLDDSVATVTAVRFSVGKNTLLVGDSTGRTTAWFPVSSSDFDTQDNTRLVCGHVIPGDGTAVTDIATSVRSRLFAALYGSGRIRLHYVTSERRLADLRLSKESQPDLVCLAPKDDFLVALAGGGVRVWKLEAPHPEVSLKAVFAPVWYEGYPKPAHVWQSTGGTDAFEPKFGLVPLIFGTLKATLYSILFGAPLALLAAVYSSEFLHPRWRRRMKTVIEMMASLPSVVLGFLAALVFAPIVARIVPQVLCGIVLVPVFLLLGGYLWQLVPRRKVGFLRPLRPLLMFAMLALACMVAAMVGKPVEQLLWAGDIKQWLAGQIGRGTGGWFLLLLPLAALVAGFIIVRFVTPQIRSRVKTGSWFVAALVQLLVFILGLVLWLILAWLGAETLTVLGWDPRGPFFGTYVQRNALVVGFVMGFAIIPIIYTLAEDALSAVPSELRAASLAAGATPWQTAMRIVVPAAASGLFSALMIGLGRAVGETMIVLMAAGNTPIIDLNIFNGFRTLSANIAVELPEAVQNSTHYRMLFLCALCLFVMTFVINTLAEIVRLRVREKAARL